MTVEWLARLQFMLAVSFHYLFPPLTLGLGVCMLISQGLYLKSDKGEDSSSECETSLQFSIVMTLYLSVDISSVLY